MFFFMNWLPDMINTVFSVILGSIDHLDKNAKEAYK